VESLKHKTLMAEDRVRMISLQCRYMLIMASLNELANVPIRLFMALLDKGLWTPAQALARTRLTQILQHS
jgi:hypothetical protein